jgi:hypothetical protein
MKEKLRMLIIADTEKDFRPLLSVLEKGGYLSEYERVKTAAEMKRTFAKTLGCHCLRLRVPASKHTGSD